MNIINNIMVYNTVIVLYILYKNKTVHGII